MEFLFYVTCFSNAPSYRHTPSTISVVQVVFSHETGKRDNLKIQVKWAGYAVVTKRFEVVVEVLVPVYQSTRCNVPQEVIFCNSSVRTRNLVSQLVIKRVELSLAGCIPL